MKNTKLSMRGFSLAEMMVAVVIGMIAVVFVMRSSISFEANRRSNLGGSDSLQNGVLALYSMENDAAQAGWGINDPLEIGCNAAFFDSQNYAGANVAGGVAGGFRLAPVSVVFNGVNSDVISFNSGTSDAGSGSADIFTNVAAGATAIPIDRAPNQFKYGDVLLITPWAANGTGCTIAQVSDNPPQLPPAALQLHVASDGTAFTRFNRAGGLLAAYAGPNAARVFNLGQGNALQFHTWSVQNGVLMLRATDITGASNAAVSAVADIVSIKALYGFDTRPSATYNTAVGVSGQVISQWSAAMIDADGDGTVGGPGDYQRMSAVRLAVVARSHEMAKPDSSGNCNLPDTPATYRVFYNNLTNAPIVEPVGTGDVSIAVNLSSGENRNWRCFHYRTFEAIVPLRNSGWSPS